MLAKSKLNSIETLIPQEGNVRSENEKQKIMGLNSVNSRK